MQNFTGSSHRDDVFLFDSLSISKKLQEEGGFTQKQAETCVTIFYEIITSNLATKRDIESIRRDIEFIRRDIESLRKDNEQLRKETTESIERSRKETTEHIEQLRKEINLEIRLVESRIVTRLGAIIVAGISVLAILMKLL